MMKKCVINLIIILLIASCTHVDKKAEATLRMKKEALDFASGYVMGKLKNPQKVIGADGVITVTGDDQTSYIINPANISIGLINDDNIDDVIASLEYYHSQYLILTEHLFLINTDGKLQFNCSIESDMKILGIKNQIITAEVYTKSRNGPLANCHVCKEVVKYKFRQGELIKTE